VPLGWFLVTSFICLIEILRPQKEVGAVVDFIEKLCIVSTAANQL
jgi:hypothetical protein